ncbi:MAG: UDP-N-acetylmuramyl-tripeptide synthetase [Treponema sp.]|nr:UDP-N-acetylmuramyl-tripeptide synthetase [Treponema sp.]
MYNLEPQSSEGFPLEKIFSSKECSNKCRNKIKISGLSFNSKNINKNEIFIAVKGYNTDGIKYAKEAVSKGAKAIVCDKRSVIPEDIHVFLKQNNIPLFKVNNPESAAAKTAKIFYPKQPEFIFAITGTNGKTTIAVLTMQLLNLAGYKETAVLGTMGFLSENKKFGKLKNEINKILGINPLTTPDTITLHKILDMSYHAGVKYLVIEASSDGIFRSRIDEIKFTSCGLSNICEDHLITHGTMKNYIDAKFSLFSRLSSGKTAVYNNDNKYSGKLSGYINRKLSDKKLKIIKYGITSQNNEIQIKDIKQKKKGYKIIIEVFGREYSAEINLTGEFQIYSAMNALAFALSVIPKKDIEQTVNMLKKLKTVNGRMELVNKTRKGASVYIDYAHNPASLETALIELKKITKGKIISVTGISSGKSESRNDTARIAGIYADIVIFSYISPTSEPVDEIIARQRKIFPQGLHGGQTRFEAIKKAIDMAEDGDSILINGQGHERFIVEYGKPVPFYDTDAVNEIISSS